MLVVILAWGAYLFLGFQIINHRIQIAGFVPSLIILAVVFFVLVFWTVHRLTTPKRAQQAAARYAAAARPAAPPSAVTSGSITFRAAGTTFDNANGESRQDILRHMKFGDAPWADDPDDLIGRLEETSHNGEPVIAVLVNEYQVGFVPKTQITRVSEAMKNVATCHVSDVRIVGGGTDQNGNPYNYGCEITVDY